MPADAMGAKGRSAFLTDVVHTGMGSEPVGDRPQVDIEVGDDEPH